MTELMTWIFLSDINTHASDIEVHLSLNSSYITVFPSMMQNARELHVSINNARLKEINGSVGLLTNLRSLSLNELGWLERIDDAFLTLPALTVLTIDTCRSLEILPLSNSNNSTLFDLPSLEKLIIERCGFTWIDWNLDPNKLISIDLNEIPLSVIPPFLEPLNEKGTYPNLTYIRFMTVKRLPEAVEFFRAAYKTHPNLDKVYTNELTLRRSSW